MLEQEEVVAGREVAVFVEDAVVREEPLADESLDLAAGADRARVVKVAVEVRGADERDDSARGPRDLGERLLGCANEARPEQEVLRRIARHRELREDHQVGARALRLLEPVEDQRAVAVEVADDRIDLGEREPHTPKGTRFGYTSELRTPSQTPAAAPARPNMIATSENPDAPQSSGT